MSEVRLLEPPVVYLGPSIALDHARRLLPDARYEPPIKRGDLEGIPAGSVVGIIDGVFDQSLSVSPREVYDALERGVYIMGASSMGALRAVEVEGVFGVGRVYEMYRDGVVDSDDEVAMLFEEDSHRAVSEPLVNIRYAVASLVDAGTIEPEVAARLIDAARSMPYPQRTYRNVVSAAGLRGRADADELLELLARYDLKQEDAQLLLESLPEFRRAIESGTLEVAVRKRGPRAPEDDPHAGTTAKQEVEPDATVLLWEFGDTFRMSEMVPFLALTGSLRRHVSNAVLRFALEGHELEAEGLTESSVRDRAQQLFQRTAMAWGWRTHEEVNVTLVDLGLGLADVNERLREETIAQAKLERVVRQRSSEFLKALRVELLYDDLALKRHGVRLGSLRSFAERGRATGVPLTAAERSDATAVLCQKNRLGSLPALAPTMTRLGLTEAEVSQFVDDVAYARRAGGPLLARMLRPEPPARSRSGEAVRWSFESMTFRPSPKAPGSARFSLPMPEADRIASHLANVIGVTRVGMIGELSELRVHVAQAFRPHGRWSSTIGSGKSETKEGARVGGIMEEVEKYAQEAFTGGPTDTRASFEELVRRGDPVVDPAELALPYDSRYRPDATLTWTRGFDLVEGQPIWVPLDALVLERVHNDIYYSRRRGAKAFFTNGLASGFTLEEATVHALAEFIERHTEWLATLQTENPGGLGCFEYPLVDLDTVPAATRELTSTLLRGAHSIHLSYITTDVRVPTFRAKIICTGAVPGRFNVSVGYATHPNPCVAMNMALLEAAQTQVGNIAGSREDLTIKARSLGRHERSRPISAGVVAAAFGQLPFIRFRDIGGFVTDDVLEELKWMVDRLEATGARRVVVADYSREDIAPARVVRVIVPGFETTNPFCCGPRARALAIADLLPRCTSSWPRE